MTVTQPKFKIWHIEKRGRRAEAQKHRKMVYSSGPVSASGEKYKGQEDSPSSYFTV